MQHLTYITSLGHSGSTLLDMVLGSHSRSVSLGEFHRLRESWESNVSCSCGYPVSRCSFWRQVRRDLPRNTEFDSRMSDSAPESPQRVRRLLQSVSSVSGATHLVESSKQLDRLRLYFGSDVPLGVIHLTRHPLAVAHSYHRKKATPIARALLAWRQRVARTRTVLASLGCPALTVRYEDLCLAPLPTVERIASWQGLSSEAEQQLRYYDSKHHLPQGNRLRLRLAERLPLRLSADWQQHVSAAQRMACLFLVASLLPAHGYTTAGVRDTLPAAPATD